MYPVYAIVGENQEALRLVSKRCNGDGEMHVLQRYRKEKIGETKFIHVVVQLGVTADFTFEPRQSKESHGRKSAQTALNFELDLVFEKAWMFHHLMIEDVTIGEASEDEVQEDNPGQGDG